MSILCIALASVGLSLLAPLAAQTQVATWALPGPFGEVGQEVGIASDADGDGVVDLLAAGPSVLALHSSGTGEELAAVTLPGILPLGIAGVPDIDGDGLVDAIVADGVSARAVSLADGSVLWTQPGSLGGSIGWSLALLDDQDGDLFPDVAVGEPDADPHGLSSAGSIFVLSGDDGTLIHRIDGTAAQQQVGIGMDAGPDYDGDGRRDLFVGDTDFQVAGITQGRVRILRAVDGVELLSIANDQSTTTFGRLVASAGDVDGDGLADVAVTTNESGAALEAFSTGTGLELWDDTTNPSAMVSVGDGDGDGIPALVTGHPTFFFNATARILNGATGGLIHTLTSGGAASYADLAAPGDTDGDGKVELYASSGGSQYFPVDPAGLHQELPTGIVLNFVQNEAGGDGLGLVVDAAGDLDGDDVTDWIVASSSRLVVFSGADESVLLDADPQLDLQSFFFTASAGAGLGDVDRDDVPDIALANAFFSLPSFLGRVEVLSGADGSILVMRDAPAGAEQFGLHLADTTDHDGDGVRDLYVSAPTTDIAGFVDAGEVYLLSSATLQTLDTLQGLLQSPGQFGVSLSADGDLTGDGVPELAVGSHDDGPGQFNAGALYVLDGASHAELHHVDGALNAGFVTGAITGDLDGDDVPDLVAAEPQYVVPGESFSRGRVRAFSGADYSLLWTRTGPWSGSWFGGSSAGAGDVNGDGYGDVAVTSRPQVSGADSGTVFVLSGPDGSTLDEVLIASGAPSLLGPVRSAGLLDEGGCAEVVVGVPGHIGEGGAFVYASSQGGVHGFIDLGAGKAGSNGETPTLRGYGDLAAGGLVSLVARHALPFKSCTWFVGIAPGFVPFKQGTLVPSPFALFFAIPLATDASGEVVISAANPAAVFEGLSLWHQLWFSDTAATAKVSASNGLQEIFK